MNKEEFDVTKILLKRIEQLIQEYPITKVVHKQDCCDGQFKLVSRLRTESEPSNLYVYHTIGKPNYFQYVSRNARVFEYETKDILGKIKTGKRDSEIFKNTFFEIYSSNNVGKYGEGIGSRGVIKLENVNIEIFPFLSANLITRLGGF